MELEPNRKNAFTQTIPQKIFRKVNKSSKAIEDQKTFISAFAWFFIITTEVLFLESENWHVSTQF